MAFKVITEVTQEDGQLVREEYKGSAFAVVVTSDEGIQVESSIGSSAKGVLLIAGAVASVAGIAKNNGVSIAEIVSMVSEGAKKGVLQVLGHECTNCGKCGKRQMVN